MCNINHSVYNVKPFNSISASVQGTISISASLYHGFLIFYIRGVIIFAFIRLPFVKIKMRLGAVAHACNHSTLGG